MPSGGKGVILNRRIVVKSISDDGGIIFSPKLKEELLNPGESMYVYRYTVSLDGTSTYFSTTEDTLRLIETEEKTDE